MVDFLGSIMAFLAGEQASTRIIGSMLILVFGHLAVRVLREVANDALLRNGELNKKEILERKEIVRYTGYLLDAGIVTGALMYLNNASTERALEVVSTYLPRVLTAGLVILLGLIAIKIFSKLGENFLNSVGVQSYFRDLGLSKNATKIIAMVFKAFLYLILFQLALAQIGIGDTFVRDLIMASAWAGAFLVAALIFYGFRGLVENFAAGIYLKNSRHVRKGEEIELNGLKGTIRDVSLFSSSIDTVEGKTVVKENKELMRSDFLFKRSKSDVDTLEEIRGYFVEEKDGMHNAAVLEIVMEILGFRVEQNEVNQKIEEGEGDLEENITSAVEEFTENKVKIGHVEEENITDLSAELKTWFNDEALVTVKVKRSELFSEHEEEVYVLCVGVEQDEILVVDPNEEGGGVYYVRDTKLRDAMKQAENPGYLVFAPESTTAQWRLKNDLLYSDKALYDEISKTLEDRLRKIMRQGRLLKDAAPSSVNRYIDSWRSDREVTRLWSPTEDDKDQTSDDN